MIIWCGGYAYSSPTPLLFRNRKPLIRHFSSRQAFFHCVLTIETETAMELLEPKHNGEASPACTAQPMSKRAQKRLLKQQSYAAKKAEKKAQMKEHKKKEAERRQKEWAEKLSSVGDEERSKLIEERIGRRKERMEQRSELKGMKIARLREAMVNGQNVVIDLEFAHLMNPNERNSLVHQIMYSYACNGTCASPAHIWLTGCQGELQNELQQISGYDKWVMEKEETSYVEVFQDQKENLVYLTADSENVLCELNPKAIYVIGGLVDRNRWKGITLKKAKEQGIKTAKLPIGEYLKMCSSQVLTVNQVVEILLKFLETKDWKTSFFQVIPQRKRFESENQDNDDEVAMKDALVDINQNTLKAQEVAVDIEDEDDQKIESIEEDGQELKTGHPSTAIPFAVGHEARGQWSSSDPHQSTAMF